MGKRIAIIVVVDGLRADALSCYGNARAATPFLSRLAGESVVFDFAYCVDATLEGLYEAALLGVHPAYRYAGYEHRCSNEASRPNLVGSTENLLYTDDAVIAGLDLRPQVWADVFADKSGGPVASEGSVVEQGYFLRAAEWLGGRLAAGTAETAMGWVHVSSLARMEWPVGASDNAQRARREYNAAVTAIDAGVRTLFSELSFPDETSDILFIVMGARGVALGERGGFGVEPAALQEELLHVPLIVHRPECRAEPCRVSQLTSPVDLHAVLSHWLEGKLELSVSNASTSETVSDGDSSNWLLFANERGDRALRTPGWYLMRPFPTGGSPEHVENDPAEALYLKPDDRWEFNEVLDRRSEIAAALSERLDALLQQAAAGEPLELPPLPAELVKGG